MSSLHVIYRNNKNTIQVLPSNTMLEVLQKGCASYRLDDKNYSLNHNDKPVNLSLPFRLSGIPNQSRVTIVDKKPSTTVTVKTVNLALQFSTGQRAQLTGIKTSTTLWDILKQFEDKLKLAITNQFDAQEQYICPSLNILNNEINTIQELQQTTLVKLHVTESVLLKLSFKTSTDLSKQQALDLISNYQPPIETPVTSPTTTTTTTNTSPTTTTSNTSPKTPTATNTIETPVISPTTTATTTNTSPTNTNTIETSIIPTTTTIQPTIDENNNNTSPMNIDSLSTTTSNSDSDHELLSNRIMNFVNEFKKDNPPPTNNTLPNSTPETTTSNNNNSNSSWSPTEPMIFKYGSVSTIKNKPEIKIKEEITLEDKDRNLKVYVPVEQDLNLGSVPHNENLSEDDLKRLHESNKREKKAKEDETAILKTKDMREKDLLKKMARYSKTNIRVYFPSKQVLEMTFLSKEKIGNLIKYLKSLFNYPQPLFYLYTTPPYSIIHDFNSTFLKQGLIPNAKIYLGFQSGVENMEFIDEVNEMLVQAHQEPTLTGSSIIDNFKENYQTSTTTTTTTTTTSTNVISDNNNDKEMYDSQESNNNSTSFEPRKPNNEKVVPKWFMAGKKK